MIVRCITQNDIHSLVNGEQESNDILEPWSFSDYYATLTTENYFGIVVDIAGIPVGCAIYSAEPNSLLLHRIWTHADCRFCGIATQLLGFLIGCLDRKRSVLECVTHETYSNLHNFFAKRSFKSRLERDYYLDGDAYVFYFPLSDIVAPDNRASAWNSGLRFNSMDTHQGRVDL